MRKIAINTGGGDAPGLNAVIRAAVLAAHRRGWEVWGIRKGYAGLLGLSDGLIRLTPERVAELTDKAGTILGANNRGNPFALVGPDGDTRDHSTELIQHFRSQGFDALIAIGGDGSLAIANELFTRHGLPVVGVPKTIDNDLDCTDYTFGFDTAVTTATEALDKVHATAKSHDRVIVVEVMGRHAGWIALHAGLAGSAHAILLPEIPFSLSAVGEHLTQRYRNGEGYGVIVVAEGARPEGGELRYKADKRLGGIAAQVATALADTTGLETRELVLGHLQRGGQPTAFDRILSLRLGAGAIQLIEQGQFGQMVALSDNRIRAVSLESATRRMRLVPLDNDLLSTARELGICLGQPAS